jgi:hypothetical protein
LKLGNFDIPEQRLIPTVADTLEEIYKVKKRDRVQSKDLAILLGFKYGTEPHYYRKIHSLQEYGLMEGKGNFQITELGEKVLHPRSDQEKALAITKAVLSVPLWKEIYQKQGKKPREDNFWAVLVDITKVDPDTAKANGSKILGWYENDIAHVSDDLVGQNIEASKENIETKGLSSKDSNIKSMSQQMMQPSGSDYIKYELRKATIYLPKDNPKKEWEKIKKMIDIDLEDYEESLPSKSEDQPQE